MKLTRRTFLQATGATASAAATAGAGGVAATVGAREAALTAGNGPYAVVGDKGVLEVCSNYHDAVRQASELRHLHGAQTRHIRCTQSLAQELSANPDFSWIDVDGLAVTPSEAETRGFEFLRRARDPERTRHLLWQHHLNSAREKVERADLAHPDTHWYATEDEAIVAVAEKRGLLLGETASDALTRIHACTPQLAEALRAHLAGGPKPEINSSVARHMTPQEFETRLAHDVWFRVAVQQPREPRMPVTHSETTISMVAERKHNWLVQVVETNEERPPTETLSAHAAAVLRKTGFIMPGFWRELDGVIHHLDSFAANVPQPSLAGKPVRHQNRHT